MKKIIIIFCLFYIGCASRNMVTFKVDSEPKGCQVEVDGITYGATPTNIDLEFPRTWVGYFRSSDGWEYNEKKYTILCYPSGSETGKQYVQTKYIKTGQKIEAGNIFFNMKLKPDYQNKIQQHEYDINIK